MNEKILRSIADSVSAINQLALPEAVEFIEGVANRLVQCFLQGGKVLIAGNGGSMCDATHFAEELTGLFRGFRPPLPAIALADPGHLSCVANDLGFSWVFARAIEAYGKEGDLFIGLSTSGNSDNMVKAFALAKERGLITVAFLGKGGGKLKGFADCELIIEAMATSDRIQEAHMTALHILVEMVEELFGERNPSSISTALRLKSPSTLPSPVAI